MKSYEIEIKRTSFMTITVEAESTDEAEKKAWEEIEKGNGGSGYADWEIEFIDEPTKGETA